MNRNQKDIKEETAIIPNIMGFTLKKALQQIGEQTGISADCVKVEMTMTPYEDKKRERQGNEPIVVRQVVSGNEIKLTASIFK